MTESEISCTSGISDSASIALPSRASLNMRCICALALLQTAVAVRNSSVKLLDGGGTGVEAGAGGGCAAGAHAGARTETGRVSASSCTSRPCSGSIHTSAITLSCSFLSCSASRITKRVFQNG